jgi:hypothetical protein
LPFCQAAPTHWTGADVLPFAHWSISTDGLSVKNAWAVSPEEPPVAVSVNETPTSWMSVENSWFRMAPGLVGRRVEHEIGIDRGLLVQDHRDEFRRLPAGSRDRDDLSGK